MAGRSTASEQNPIPAVKRPDTGPSPRSSAQDLAEIPSMDVGHGKPNFPRYPQDTSTQGIPHVEKLEQITPGALQGGALDMPGATPGERGL